jgi:2-(1,2-epoxy-1,2-dihydrophenyl)acetyl-CoA isomerase
MLDFNTILFEENNGVATITLNRPKAAHGINLALAKELLTAALHCENKPTIRAIVITSQGKMFCAGGDLKDIASEPDRAATKMKELIVHLHAAITRFARMNTPVIIAVNGTAAGAGFSLAASGDMVLAADSARFTMAYTAAGLSPDGSASYYLPRLIGLRKTQELMLTNRVLSASEALDWGIITRVVADEDLQTQAQNLANDLAQGPTQAYGAVKKLLHASFSNGLETQLDLEARNITHLVDQEDGREGVKAFTQKRAPLFHGR